MSSVIDIRSTPDEITDARNQYLRVNTEDNKIYLATVLTASENNVEIKEGLRIFEKLMTDGDRDDLRTCVYYTALAHARLKNYDRSLGYLKALLDQEPTNIQVTNLKNEIEKRMTRDGLIGGAILAGGVAVVGVIGALLLKR